MLVYLGRDYRATLRQDTHNELYLVLEFLLARLPAKLDNPINQVRYGLVVVVKVLLIPVYGAATLAHLFEIFTSSCH